MSNFENFLISINKILPQVRALCQVGATSYLVGGSTRDLLMDRPVHDFDIEVHGIDFDQLKNILKKFGVICCAGKMFMVIKTPDFDADWAIPRIDGAGRRPTVQASKDLDIKTASLRRDLTINSISLDLNKLNKDFQTILLDCKAGKRPIDVLSFQDPFGGIEDVKNGILKAVDEQFFIQDPLRFFRVMQFVARFEFKTDDLLDQICSQMEIDRKNAASQSYVSAERITEEFRKMILKSERPSLGLCWVQKVGRLNELFPESFFEFKSEIFNDAFICGCQAMDFAAKFQEFRDESERLFLSISALLQAFREKLKKQDENLPETDFVRQFLSKFKFSSQINDSVEKLIKYLPILDQLLSSTVNSEGQIKELADNLSPEANLRKLVMLSLFCSQAQNGSTNRADLNDRYSNFIQKAKTLGVFELPEPSVLSGADLIGKVKPGPEMGALLKKAYKLQILYGIKSKEILLKKILEEG